MTTLYSGQKIGNLTVLYFSHRKDSRDIWKCGCRCGWYTEVPARSLLKSNPTTSCGHCRPDVRFSSEHESWLSMKARCYIPNRKDYHRYGGRGIVVCKEWFNFFNFLDDMGFRPEGHTLDRIDCNGNYEKNNCKWSNIHEQNQNRNPRNTFSINYPIKENLS